MPSAFNSAMPEPLLETSRRWLRTSLGFLLGLALCLVSLLICMPLGGVLGFSKPWTFAMLYGLVLLAEGVIALRKAESAFAQGILIAVSVAILVDGMVGVLATN